MPANTSFLPEDYLARKMARRSNLVCLTLFFVVLSFVLGAYFVKYRQNADARDRNLDVTLRTDDRARVIAQVEEVARQRQEIQLKVAITTQLKDPVTKSFVLFELINNMPAALWLTELEVDTTVPRTAPRPRTALQAAPARNAPAAPAVEPPPPPADVTIRMTGLAPTDAEVSRYMSTLAEHPLFGDVRLVFAEAHFLDRETEMRRFQVELRLIPGVTRDQVEPTLPGGELRNDPLSPTMTIQPDGMVAVPTQP